MNYYNEIEPYCAAWLRNLMDAGHIPAGDIDTRSIEDVRPSDLRGYTQCHFFAGLGGWPYALALAGWPVDRPVWTGRCPCQPFSAAGRGAGFADKRHLWPAWHHLISQCRPAVVFGEQVASKDADAWIDLVHADLAGLGYAYGCEPFPAAGIGAPHIRDRNFWVADADHERRDGQRVLLRQEEPGWRADHLPETSRGGGVGWLADSMRDGTQPTSGWRDSAETAAISLDGRTSRTGSRTRIRSTSDRMEYAMQLGRQRRETAASGYDDDRQASEWAQSEHGSRIAMPHRLPGATGPINGFWADADWLLCTDGKWRPVEPGTFPLAHGIPARVGRLRAYGNAIVPQAAAAFIGAYLDIAAVSAEQVAA
jgi:DNA (cytosine-5)-methyltransferase 1